MTEDDISATARTVVVLLLSGKINENKAREIFAGYGVETQIKLAKRAGEIHTKLVLERRPPPGAPIAASRMVRHLPAIFFLLSTFLKLHFYIHGVLHNWGGPCPSIIQQSVSRPCRISYGFPQNNNTHMFPLNPL